MANCSRFPSARGRLTARHPISRALQVATLLVALAACGAENTLGGSIATYSDLSFTKLQITGSSSGLVVAYARSAGELAARISVDVKAAPNLASGKPFVLADDAFKAGVTVTRLIAPTSGEAVSKDVFPDVIGGALTMEKASLKKGAQVSGNFTVTFAKGKDKNGGDIADGYQLYGNFQGTVE